MDYRRGSILDAESGLICHGVNCFETMGAGLAKAIRDRWPYVYEYYKLSGSGPDLLGEIRPICIRPEPKLWVVNCYTQVYYGRRKPFRGEQHLDYQALKSCLYQCVRFASLHGGSDIHLPRIGCGLAGGDWDRVHSIIDAYAHLIPITIWEL